MKYEKLLTKTPRQRPCTTLKCKEWSENSSGMVSHAIAPRERMQDPWTGKFGPGSGTSASEFLRGSLQVSERPAYASQGHRSDSTRIGTAGLKLDTAGKQGAIFRRRKPNLSGWGGTRALQGWSRHRKVAWGQRREHPGRCPGLICFGPFGARKPSCIIARNFGRFRLLYSVCCRKLPGRGPKELRRYGGKSEIRDRGRADAVFRFP